MNLQFNESATAVASDWNVIRGQFLAINSFLMSCRCHLSRNGVSPTAHLGDGCADLILIRPCSRIQFLQHLYRCMLGNGSVCIFILLVMLLFDWPFICLHAHHSYVKTKYLFYKSLWLCLFVCFLIAQPVSHLWG